MRINRTVLFVIFLYLLAVLPGGSQTRETQKESKTDLSPRVYDKVAPTIVRITCDNNNKKGSGCIVGISPQNMPLILTAAHVVTQNFRTIQSRPELNIPPTFYRDIKISIGEQDEQVTAMVLSNSQQEKESSQPNRTGRDIEIGDYYNFNYDLILLAAQPTDCKRTIRYNHSKRVKPGQFVAAFGYPRHSMPTVTTGTIKRKTATIFYTNAEIIKGNSGGPLIDKYGRMIGMVQATKEGEGTVMKMDIISTIVDNWLQDLKEKNLLRETWKRQKYETIWHRFYKDPKFWMGYGAGAICLYLCRDKNSPPEFEKPEMPPDIK